MNIDYTFALAQLGLPIGWDGNGNIVGLENLTDEQRAAVDAAIAAYDPLPFSQKAACDTIDTEAEVLRSAVLTPGSGQMAAYQEKERQAFEYLEAIDPVDSDFPDLVNEVGVTADSVLGVAHAVAVAAAAWRVYGRYLERTRLASKKLVMESNSVSAVEAALAAIAWP